MSKNELEQYLSDMLYFDEHGDKEGMEALLREGEGKYVTLKDVALSLIDHVNDLGDYIDSAIEASQALTEERLIAIVSCLDGKTIEVIKEKFEEAEDDLLNNESEETDNE